MPRKKDFVYWNQIGLVHEANYDFLIEKTNGILDTTPNTKEEWEKYGGSYGK